MVFIALKALIFGDPVAGFPSLIVIITLLGGIQLIMLGIIGEYLGRAFYESKGRVFRCSVYYYVFYFGIGLHTY